MLLKNIDRISGFMQKKFSQVACSRTCMGMFAAKSAPIQTKMLSGDILGDVILGKNCSGEILNQEEG